MDYRNGEDSTISAIKSALRDRRAHFAVDAVSDGISTKILGQILDRQRGTAHIARVLPVKPEQLDLLPGGVKATMTIAPSVFQDVDPQSEAGKPEFRGECLRGIWNGLFKRGW